MPPLHRLFHSCLLRPGDFAPSRKDLEVIGAFNPGAAQTAEGVVLLVRVAEQAAERRVGYTALPRYDSEARRIVLDWESNSELAPIDMRVVQRRREGVNRLTFISSLRVARSRDGRKIDSIGPVFAPETEYEEYGVEDARITKIGETYYFTYVAVSRHGAATALASTDDFQTFQRHGIIFNPENKDVVLFPQKIGGVYYALHRPTPAQPFCKPEMWIASSPDLLHWGHHHYFLGGADTWEMGRIGAGTPPIRTARGWLEIYHGNSKRAEEANIGAYSGGVLLMDVDEPRKIIGASGAVFVPDADYEREGFVPNVVFPTGMVVQGDKALIYYGAADTYTGVVEFSLQDLIRSATRRA